MSTAMMVPVMAVTALIDNNPFHRGSDDGMTDSGCCKKADVLSQRKTYLLVESHPSRLPALKMDPGYAAGASFAYHVSCLPYYLNYRFGPATDVIPI